MQHSLHRDHPQARTTLIQPLLHPREFGSAFDPVLFTEDSSSRRPPGEGFARDFLKREGIYVPATPLTLLVIAGSVVPMIAVTVRRLHDSGRPGTHYFLGFIPIAGPVLLLIALCAPSDPLPNAYGAPRGGVVAGYAPGYGYQQV